MKNILALILALCALPGTKLAVLAQGTAFTYQGRLNANGAPANGSYDLAFKLFATNVSGTPIAGPVTNAAVSVSNGLFTTTVDFGAVFTGESNWLELAVSAHGANAFNTLAPRQQLTPVPYALTAASVSGPVGLSQLPSSLVTNGASGVTISGTFSGNGAGVTNVPGTMPWQSVAGTSQAAVPNQAYLLTNSAPTTVTLPTTANVGDVVTVSGVGSNGWQVSAAGQAIAGYPAGIYWTENTNSPLVNWSSVASSADGTKLVATVYRGSIYTSTNSGVTWSANSNAPTATFNWSVASSADGAKLVTAPFEGPIYTSTDSGLIWSANNNAPSGPWSSVASSADGVKLVAVSGFNGQGQIYTSTDSGVTWSTNNNAPSTNWSCVASSADGTKLVAASALFGQGQIYTSTNSGLSWSANNNAPSAGWISLASSVDGTKLVAVVNGGQIYTSTNSGLTWSANNNAPSAYWASVASSADGAKLVTVVNGGQIYSSINSGLTWSANNNAPSANWASVASSADGTRLVAPVDGGEIWTSVSAYPGVPGVTAKFQYVGNGLWQPVGEAASQIIGTLPVSDLPTSVVMNGQSGVTLSGVFTGVFSGNGSGLTLNPSIVTNGESGVTLAGTFSGNGTGLTLNPNVVTNGESGVTLAGTFSVTNGNVGIATTSPGKPLQIGTTLNPADAMLRLACGNGSAFRTWDVGVPYGGTNISGSNYSFVITDPMHNAARLMIDWNTGDVCIGTINPIGLLTVSNAYCNGTSWVNASDRNAKQDFAPVDKEQILERVVSLPIESWTYKVQPADKHIGPMAQDFHAAFGLNGVDDKHIATVDESGVALAAIQGLNQRLEEKETEIAELKARVQKLEEFIDVKLNVGGK